MLTRYKELYADGKVRLFGVRLFPWGFRPFFQKEPRPFNDAMVSLAELLDEAALRDLEGKLAHAELDEAVAHLEEFLLQRLTPSPEEDAPFLEILAALYQNPMEHDVSQAVAASGYSQRQFERKCREWTGLSPKRLHKISRFNLARLTLFANPRLDLHQCMTQYGYYDYSHFSKDFKLCLGITPAEYQKWILDMQAKWNPDHHVVFLQDEEGAE